MDLYLIILYLICSRSNGFNTHVVIVSLVTTKTKYIIIDYLKYDHGWKYF